ncbi:DNA-binding CsgD family transcriptional regulator [Inquilinus ginsengisoli]|uniref:DNA-binding CsgD family transcriptional regulator n=1 Tax=Inquilinus ginsengisoli TaxID=363840 RepID=A0ABU1JNI3_9PROT|nr:LuxR C-terminal-related transcriptional regulator [Inquilinus ginsengisoli]MDR6290184.1 DNA-binding CsgD family transcriptional regulator [Inquilinus ginsengisoli]
MGFAAWNAGLAAAMAAVGSDGFPDRLGEALAGLVGFDMLNGFAYRGDAPPLDLHNRQAPDLAAIIVDGYIAGAYLLDPFFVTVRGGTPDRVLVMRDLAPDRFGQSEYYKRHYIRARILDEVGYVLDLGRGLTGVLSVTRRRGHARFSRAEVETLREAAPMVCALGERHWAGFGAAAGAGGAGDLVDRLIALGDGRLTRREAEVVGLILKGHSSPSICALLGFGQETVKTHRKSIHRKLGISSQAELFARFTAFLAER